MGVDWISKAEILHTRDLQMDAREKYFKARGGFMENPR